MLPEANAAKTVDFDKLAAFDKARAPLSFSVDRNDSRYFSNFNQWKQESVDVGVGTRSVNIRTDVFKYAAHVPLDARILNAGVAYSRSTESAPIYQNTPNSKENVASVLQALFALPLGLGALGSAIGFLANPRERWKYAKKGFVLGAGSGGLLNGTGCDTLPTPAAEVTTIPTEITQAAPATKIVETSTSTPPPGFQTETPVAPSDIIGSHPDYKDASVGKVAFTHGATEAQLTDPNNPLKLPEYALDAYSENIEAIRAKVTGEESAYVFWNSTYDRNFVLLTRVESGITQVAVIAAGEDNFSYHPNAEWFDFNATENPAYTWVALPAGVAATDLVGGYFGDYPVWGIQKDSETMPSQLFVPGAESGFEKNPAVPVEVAKFSIDSLSLAPDVAAALKKHAGLEASIVAEADGFTTQITYWDADHKLVTENIGVNPAVMTEDLTSINKFGDTPVMLTSEGQKLYWSQEHKGWFKIEMSPDINNPVFIPYEYRDVALRAVIAENNQPFSQEALDWFKTILDQGIQIGFQYLEVNANTHQGTKFAFLRNTAMGDDGRTLANSPVQNIDAWFVTQLPDGTTFQFFPTKWLDPVNPLAPKGNEWKILFAASGEEIMGDEANRTKYDKMWTDSSNPKSQLEVIPIVFAENGFFNDTNGLITLGVPQPSLAKLETEADKNFATLTVPVQPPDTFGMWIRNLAQGLSLQSPTNGFGYFTKADPTYTDQFFPAEAQLVLYPSLITLR